MEDINISSLSGNLTKDAELKTFDSGYGVLNFTIASNKRVKKGDDWEDKPSFIPCKYFSKGAEKLKQFLTKGKPIVVSGYIDQENWEKDGQKQSRLVICCEKIKLCGPGKASDNGDGSFPEDVPF